MTDLLVRVAVVAVVVVAAGMGWRRWHPASFWYLVAFPLRAVMVYCTWRAVASGCGLARKRRRWRWTFPGFPGLGG